MTRAELIDSLIEKNRAKIAAEATTMPEGEPDKSNLIKFPFALGDVVCMRFDAEPSPGVVVVIELHPGQVMYRVMWCDIRSDSTHHDFELAAWREPKPARRTK